GPPRARGPFPSAPFPKSRAGGLPPRRPGPSRARARQPPRPPGGGKKERRVVAIYHCSTKPLARSSGRSAVAAAAYRAGDCLVDERQGLEHDYTRRSGVLHTQLVLPEGAGEGGRAELGNAAEEADKRR